MCDQSAGWMESAARSGFPDTMKFSCRTNLLRENEGERGNHAKNMRTSAMQDRVETFLQSVQRLPARSRRKFCRDHIEELLRKYSENTVREILVHYRKAFRPHFTERQVAQWLTFGKRRSRAHRRAYENSVSQRHATLRELDATEFLNATKILLCAPPGPRGSVAENIVGLLAATGRRLAEVFHATLEPSRFEQHLLFRGQLKTRQAPGTRQRAYHIPVLGDPALVLATWARVRLEVGKLDPITAKARYARWLNDTSRRNFGVRPHLLRAAYAAISYRLFSPESVSDTYYYAKILGHTTNTPGSETPDLTTAMSYERFFVVNLPGPNSRQTDDKAQIWRNRSTGRQVWVLNRPVPWERSRAYIAYRFCDRPNRTYHLPAKRFREIYESD